MNKEKFQCDCCGECCRHIDRIPQLQKFDPGTGVCIHLKENLCDIYDKRPLICSIDRMYDAYYNKIYSRDEYDQLNYKACISLKSERILK